MSLSKRKSCDGLDSTKFDNIKIGKTRVSSNASSLREIELPDSSGTLLVTGSDLTVNNVTVSGITSIGNGTAASPSVTFTSDTDTGFYRPAVNSVGISTGGASRLTVSNSGTTVEGLLSLPSGSATNPSATFTGDTNTGLYRVGEDSVGVSTGGTNRVTVNNSSTTLTGVLSVPTASASAPSITFTGDTNTGVYRVGEDSIGLSTGGTNRVTVNNSSTTLTGVLSVPTASASAPSITFTGDTNTGVYSGGADNVSVTCGGTNRMTVDSTNTSVNNTLIVPALDVTEGMIIGASGTGYYGSGSRIGCIRCGFINVSTSISSGSAIQVSAAAEDLPATGFRYVFANIFCPSGGANQWDRVVVSVAPNGLPTTRPGNLTFQLVNLSGSATSGSALVSWMCIVQADNP